MRVPDSSGCGRLILGELQDFLERGFDAFGKMDDPQEFLSLIVGRERRLLEALFAGDDRVLDETGGGRE